MNSQPTVFVRVSRHFDALAEHVFDAWLDPKQAGKFLFATSDGQMVRAEIDARVDGSFIFTDRRDGEDIDHTGQYLTIERPHHLAFTFRVPKYTKDKTIVHIDITRQNSGCELTLTHIGVWADYEERTKTGWNAILDGLATTLQTVALPA